MSKMNPSKKEMKKKIIESDSDSSSDSSEEEEMDVYEYRKMLSKIFPSKYMNKKIKQGEKLKKLYKKQVMDKSKKSKDKEDKEDEEDDEEDEEEDEESDYETVDEEDKEEEEEKPDHKRNCKAKDINIIFTIDGKSNKYDDYEDDDYDEDYEEEDYEESEEEDEDKSVSSDEEESDEDYETEYENSIKNEQDEVLNDLLALYEKNKENKSILKCIEKYKKETKTLKIKQLKKEKKHKRKNMRIFKKNMNDKKSMNDFAYYQKLTIPEQQKMIKDVKEINKLIKIEKPYRITILESDIPIQYKGYAMNKINSLHSIDPGSSEYCKMKNWIDTFMKIPFGKYIDLPVNISDGIDKCHEFMETSQKILDEAVYGLEDAKMQIMQMLGQLLTNPKSIGTSIAIHGFPGTGKTSLVKEGISKILNRPFVFIPLGGATDSSYLEGHSYTYEGSIWGKIVQSLIDSKCMNLIIYFDELDKVSDSPKGEEIIGILTHLTDTSQNSEFHDKYFSEISFDLSKCIFIFSYNDESKINPILRDRMYKIKTSSYNLKQKIIIGNNYLLPKIREQVKFNNNEIIIPDESMSYLIENFCEKEEGCRNLKRCLEIIHTKLNLYRLMKPDKNLFKEDKLEEVQFPITITKDIIDKLIKNDKNKLSSSLYGMYV